MKYFPQSNETNQLMPTIFCVYFPNSHIDDIPIQSADESNAANSSQLVSITEEGEAVAPDSQLGVRNSLVRSSKEILKTHKVPFPGFKKLKDKDKEKDKEAANLGGSGGTNAIMAMNNNGMSSSVKPQLIKNGSFSVDGAKESMIIAATKQLTKKDKKSSNAGLQAITVDANDTTYLDKTSPLLQMKRKSSSVDIQLTSFANGTTNGDLVTSVEPNIMGNELNTDTTSTATDLGNNKTTNTSTANAMQISQV